MKKKTAIRPSFTQPRSESKCPATGGPIDWLQTPSQAAEVSRWLASDRESVVARRSTTEPIPHSCHSPILWSHEGVPEQPVGWPMVQPSSYSASSSGAAACMRALEARRPTAARAGARQRSVAGASGSRCARGVGAKAVAPAWRSGSAAPVCATTTTSASARRGISTIKKGSARQSTAEHPANSLAFD